VSVGGANGVSVAGDSAATVAAVSAVAVAVRWAWSAAKRARWVGCRKPKERTFWKPFGKTCCKKRCMKAQGVQGQWSSRAAGGFIAEGDLAVLQADEPAIREGDAIRHRGPGTSGRCGRRRRADSGRPTGWSRSLRDLGEEIGGHSLEGVANVARKTVRRADRGSGISDARGPRPRSGVDSPGGTR